MASTQFSVRGDLRLIGAQIEKTTRDNLEAAMQIWRSELLAVLSGTRSGVPYKVPFTGRFYTASAPGQAPAQRTGTLRNSYQVSISGDGMTGRLGSHIEYAPHLEFGTSKMEPRPHLMPALTKAWPKMISRLRRIDK